MESLSVLNDAIKELEEKRTETKNELDQYETKLKNCENKETREKRDFLDMFLITVEATITDLKQELKEAQENKANAK